MIKRNRLLTIVLTMLLLVCLLPLSVSANSPAPSFDICFILTDLPKDTVYVDLLIPLPVTDPMYAELVEENLSESITAQSDIVAYCADEFRSYTYHYRNAKSEMEVYENRYVTFCTVDVWESAGDHREDIYDRGSIRLAMLDKEGTILKVSPILELRTEHFLTNMIGIFDYNAATDEFEVREKTSIIAWIVYISLCVICLLLTVVVEGLVAEVFRLKGFLHLIRRTNIISQILMHSAYVLLYAIFTHNYLLDMLILEVLVYTGEYLFYRHAMWSIPAKKCFAYTITANTASLILGVLVMGIFV